jgi:hypothetical protein
MKRMSLLHGVLVFVALGFVGVSSRAQQQDVSPKPAVPLNPITAILEAFQTHSIVALGDGAHGNEQSHAFRLSLVRDPKFAATVNDIVVECGNARYQDLMDRFVRGDDVPEASLRQVWRNTTTPTTLWDLPIREEFFRAVRTVNASLPKERQLRVLLGDPPIDWDSVHAKDDYEKWLALRDTYPAELIKREVLAKKRRALVIYGDMHFQRRNLMSNYDMQDPLAYGIVNLLEGTDGIKVFTIWANTDANADLDTLQSNVALWPVPSLAIVQGTTLGEADFTFYYPFAVPRLAVRDGKPDFSAPVPRDQWRSLRMENQFDAVLYLGPRSSMTTSRLSPTICNDADYVRTRLTRMALAGLPQSESDRLKQLCSAATPK